MSGNPTTGNTKTRRRTFSSLIRLADPNFEMDKKKELAYEFTNGKVTKRKYQNPDTTGPYGPLTPNEPVI